MNHSVKTIIEYLCEWYGVPLCQAHIRSHKRPHLKQKVVLLAGTGRDEEIAAALNCSQENVRYYRMTGLREMEVNKNLAIEIRKLNRGLMYYEITSNETNRETISTVGH